MKIGKYISELLFEKESVVLPGFGEFGTRYVPARFVPEEKKVESPSKVVTFSEKNKAEDESLAAFMAQKENIGIDKTKEFIVAFVQECHISLKAGKRVELENIGSFFIGRDGTINFEPDKSINYLNDSFGMKEVTAPVSVPEEPKAKEVPVVEKKVEKKVEKLVRPEPEAKKEPTKPEKAKKSGGSGLPPALKWFAILGIPIIVIAIVVAMNFNQLKEYLGMDVPDQTETTSVSFVQKTKDFFSGLFGGKEEKAAEVKVPTEPEVPVDTIPADTMPSGPQITETPSRAAESYYSKAEAGTTVYHIVIGSFLQENLAQDLVDQLRKKGLGNPSIFEVTRAGYYRVSYGSYPSESAANQDLEQVKINVAPQAWVVVRKN